SLTPSLIASSSATVISARFSSMRIEPSALICSMVSWLRSSSCFRSPFRSKKPSTSGTTRSSPPTTPPIIASIKHLAFRRYQQNLHPGGDLSRAQSSFPQQRLPAVRRRHNLDIEKARLGAPVRHDVRNGLAANRQ